MPNRYCDDCSFFYIKDYGYSNFTVEGSYYCCALKIREPVSDNEIISGSKIKQPKDCTCWNRATTEPDHYDVEDTGPLEELTDNEIYLLKVASQKEKPNGNR